jgi:hypothetical protein
LSFDFHPTVGMITGLQSTCRRKTNQFFNGVMGFIIRMTIIMLFFRARMLLIIQDVIYIVFTYHINVNKKQPDQTQIDEAKMYRKKKAPTSRRPCWCMNT